MPSDFEERLKRVRPAGAAVATEEEATPVSRSDFEEQFARLRPPVAPEPVDAPSAFTDETPEWVRAASGTRLASKSMTKRDLREAADRGIVEQAQEWARRNPLGGVGVNPAVIDTPEKAHAYLESERAEAERQYEAAPAATQGKRFLAAALDSLSAPFRAGARLVGHPIGGVAEEAGLGPAIDVARERGGIVGDVVEGAAAVAGSLPAAGGLARGATALGAGRTLGGAATFAALAASDATAAGASPGEVGHAAIHGGIAGAVMGPASRGVDALLRPGRQATNLAQRALAIPGGAAGLIAGEEVATRVMEGRAPTGTERAVAGMLGGGLHGLRRPVPESRSLVPGGPARPPAPGGPEGPFVGPGVRTAPEAQEPLGHVERGLPGGPGPRPGLPRGPIVTPDTYRPPNPEAIEVLRRAAADPKVRVAFEWHAKGLLERESMERLRAEGRRLGVQPSVSKRVLVDRLVARYSDMLRMGGAKAEALAGGARDVDTGERRAVPVEEVASEGRLAALREGGPDALMERAPERVDGGRNVEAGYVPIEQARAEGLIAPEAEPAVRKIQAAGGEPFSSHVDEAGRGSALGVTPEGEILRAEAPEPRVDPRRPRPSFRGPEAAPSVEPRVDPRLPRPTFQPPVRETPKAPTAPPPETPPAKREPPRLVMRGNYTGPVRAMEDGRAKVYRAAADPFGIVVDGRDVPSPVPGEGEVARFGRALSEQIGEAVDRVVKASGGKTIPQYEYWKARSAFANAMDTRGDAFLHEPRAAEYAQAAADAARQHGLPIPPEVLRFFPEVGAEPVPAPEPVRPSATRSAPSEPPPAAEPEGVRLRGSQEPPVSSPEVGVQRESRGPREAVQVEEPRKRRRMEADPGVDTISQFVRKNGGLRYGDAGMTGELDRLRRKGSGTTGLVSMSGKGLTIDRMMDEARSQGYIDRDTTRAEFLDMVETDAYGTGKVYSSQRVVSEKEQQAEYEEYLRREMQVDRERPSPEEEEMYRRWREEGEDLPPTAGSLSMMPGVLEAGRASGEVGRSVGEVIRYGLAEPLSDLAARGPVPAAKARDLRRIIAKGVEKASRLRKPYERAAEATGRGADREAFRSLTTPRWERGATRDVTYSLSRTEVVGEGAEAPTPAERAIVRPLNDYIGARGDEARKSGAALKDWRGPDGESMVPRKAMSDLYRVWREGPAGRDWQKAIDAFQEVADRHGTRSGEAYDAEKAFREMWEVSQGGDSDAFDRKAQFELARDLVRVPAFVKGAGGRTLQFFETNPRTLLDSYHRTGPVRMAFGEEMGWPDAPNLDAAEGLGESRRLTEWVRELEEAGVPRKTIRGLLRAAQNAPMERPGGLFDSGTASRPAAATAKRALATGLQVSKAAALTGKSVVAALVEPVGGPIMEVLGPSRVVRSATKAIAESLREWRTGEEGPSLRRIREFGMGAKRIPTRIDPNHPVEGAFRAAADFFLERGFSGVGLAPMSRVINERLTAIGVAEWVDGLQSGGKARLLDQRALREWGRYSPEDARRIAGGGGTAEEYQDAARRVTANIVATGLTPAERSRGEQHPTVKSAFAFLSYPLAQARTTARVFGDLAGEWTRAIRNTYGESKAQRWKRAATAAYATAKHVALRGVQGFAYQAIGYALAGGSMEQFLQRWEDDPAGEAKWAIAGGLLSGAFGNIATSALREEGLFETIGNAIYPVATTKDTIQAIVGAGRYGDKDPDRRLWDWVKARLAGTGVLEGIAAASGLAGQSMQDRVTLRRSMDDFMRWRYGPTPRAFQAVSTSRKLAHQDRETIKVSEELTSTMAKAMRMFREMADADDVRAEVRRALKIAAKNPRDETDASDVRSAILRRRLLATEDGPLGRLQPEERKALLADPPAWLPVLKKYDADLLRLADFMVPAGGGSGRPSRPSRPSRPGR